ncbi:hypothetical protein KOR42_42380 [Thalassoglobus neptunius]|uniref:Uncharacterized protein n=1 Tax=Thalassoglobus neptunius TaxID=1938619 RepID=A0A5C5WAL0_9PLAN|nr:hypothetical protein [Thalassoglobus neptunius]TWT47041.1 hypothetical protein KOR42_42380 [Thalassoglobus neptunius]
MRSFIPLSLVFIFFLSGNGLQGQDGFSLGSGVTVPGRISSPFNTWVPIEFSARNASDEDRMVLITSALDGEASQSYGRRLWLPANSVRRASYLVRTPALPNPKSDPVNAELRTMFLLEKNGVETAVTFFGEGKVNTRPIRCARDAATTLILTDYGKVEAESLVRSITDYNQISYYSIRGQESARRVMDYDGLTHLVLASRSMEMDPEAIDAVREWVFAGGRLWIMLDQTGESLANALLTDGGSLVPVDETELTSIAITSHPGSSTSGDSQEISYETPVPMVNVLADDFETILDCQGWPAAMVKPYGRGEVLVTTVGAPAWHLTKHFEARREEETPGLTRAGLSLSERFYRPKTFIEVAEPDCSEPTLSQIGYVIPSRSRVVFILIAFCAALVLVSLMQWKREQLMSMTVYAPLLAFTAMGALVAMGASSRTAIPTTSATMYIAEVDESGHRLLEGARTIYRDDAGDIPIELDADGFYEFVPSLPGAAKRMIWTDSGSVRWENLDIPAGVQTAKFRLMQNERPTAAVLSFGMDGLSGRLTNVPESEIRESLIAFPGGRFSRVEFAEGGLIQCPLSGTLADDQFVSGDVLDDRERRYVSISKELFQSHRRLPDSPRLYYWTDASPIRIDDISPERRVGDALFSVPISIHAPAPGSPFAASSSMIGYRATNHPIYGTSTVYVNQDGAWRASTSQESYTTLQCFLPDDIGPIGVSEIRATLDLRIANRELKLLVIRPDGEEQEIATWTSPVGQKQVVLQDEAFFSDDPQDFLTLLLHVGPPLQQIEGEGENALGWSINDITFEGEFVAR